MTKRKPRKPPKPRKPRKPRKPPEPLPPNPLIGLRLTYFQQLAETLREAGYVERTPYTPTNPVRCRFVADEASPPLHFQIDPSTIPEIMIFNLDPKTDRKDKP